MTSNSAFSVLGAGAGILVQRVSTETGAVASGTGTFTINDTIPTNSNGNQFMTQAITPLNSSNILVIDVVACLEGGTSSFIIGALFQDSTANALAVANIFGSNGEMNDFWLRYIMTAGTTSSTTFKFRGGGISGTTTFNGVAGARQWGGVACSNMMVSEYTQ